MPNYRSIEPFQQQHHNAHRTFSHSDDSAQYRNQHKTILRIILEQITYSTIRAPYKAYVSILER